MDERLVNNKFWDNTDPKGNGGGHIYETDLRREFLAEFSKWAEPYCTKGTHWSGKLLGLFGTASGIELIIKSGNIKKSTGMSISTLVKKFGEENSIPVFTLDNKVFSNMYALYHENDIISSKYNKYSTNTLEAYKELYGKPLYTKTDQILGKLSEFLENSEQEFSTIINYNYVGYISGYTTLLIQALKEIGEDFDVVKVEDKGIFIQEDDIELIKKFEYKYKLLKDRN